MSLENSAIIDKISKQLDIGNSKVSAVVELFLEGRTVPFIARYRKEKTGDLDEVSIKNILDSYEKITALEKRKEAILKSLVENGNHTPELEKKVLEAPDMKILEDIYAPFKPGRKTRADKAIKAGLEPLADNAVNRNLREVEIERLASNYICDDFPDAQAVIGGVIDIVAQRIADVPEIRSMVRDHLRSGFLVSKVKRGKKDEGDTYRDYFEHEEKVERVAHHRVMAILRGEKEGFLNVSVEPYDEERLLGKIERYYFRRESEFFQKCTEEAYDRLLLKTIGNEVIGEIKEKAIEASLEIFHRNLENILLAPPFGEKGVVAVDPGIRTGCKCVLLDKNGAFKGSKVLYLQSGEREAEKIRSWVESGEVEAIVCGDGTFGREAVSILENAFAGIVPVLSVDEDGASIYSASDAAREEFPDLDITVRGAISIGRRFQDPLAELVKIDPGSLGVGQYQHDIPEKMLKERLGTTVEWVVNRVGVNLNTASYHLLSYISGLDMGKAREIVKTRNENRFSSLKDIKKVKGIGPKAFEQCAGFLRILDGVEPLDSTMVHPESYADIKKALKTLGRSTKDLIDNVSIAQSDEFREFLPKSVIEELKKKGLDPREKFQIFRFSENVKTMDDLKEEMVLNGIVDNITGFGAFVDIGIKEKGLVHISQIANEFIQNPADHLNVGQKVKVKVIGIDRSRKRISLSMKEV